MKDMKWARAALDVPSSVPDERLIEWLVVHIQDLRNNLYRDAKTSAVAPAFEQLEFDLPETASDLPKSSSEDLSMSQSKTTQLRVLKAMHVRMTTDLLALEEMSRSADSELGQLIRSVVFAVRFVLASLSNAIKQASGR